MSLLGLFKYYESDAAGNILVDYQKDAKTQPATFNPLCSITGNMVMHGGGCYVDFGWYCVDPANSYTKQPVIHPLVTALQTYNYAKQTNPPFPTAWQNNDGAFLPKTSYAVPGTPLTDVANDPDFQACASHQIGFAIQGNTTQECQTTAGCACSQNKFTEQALNQVNTASGKPYIDAVIYASKNFPGRFYVAIEDLPTSPAAFAAPYIHAGATWNADGDFNDFVYTVEGVVCKGGGQLCTVPNEQGICATGVTSCVDSTSTATPSCTPVFKPQAETCNAIDDDCNGLIDDGPNLCPAGLICLKGTCVGSCASNEIPCGGGLVCNNAGYCVDPACANVTCNSDQKCVNQNGTGVCVGGCTGVTCTAGQQCVAGKCVDLCDARTQAGLPACPANFVCQNGACVPNCTCLACPDPTNQECQSDQAKPGFGRCVATGCSGVTCPSGQLCATGGNCIDPCNPNPCGAGQTCAAANQYNANGANYSCTNPNTGAGGGSSTGGAPIICLGANCNQAGSGNTGNSGNPNGTNPFGNGTTPNAAGSSSKSLGCGCRTIGAAPRGLGLAALLGIGVMAMRRRRRN
jgi:MYXO-CTERM domain-containing protein